MNIRVSDDGVMVKLVGASPFRRGCGDSTGVNVTVLVVSGLNFKEMQNFRLRFSVT